eukprot:4933615-Ditylum_brightwellii.AAC.1
MAWRRERLCGSASPMAPRMGSQSPWARHWAPGHHHPRQQQGTLMDEPMVQRRRWGWSSGWVAWTGALTRMALPKSMAWRRERL